MKADQRQNIQAKLFEKTFSLKFLPLNDFHIVKLTVFSGMLAFCFASTAMSVPVLLAACRE